MSGAVLMMDLYKTPTDQIRKSRRKFHHLRRQSNESLANWLGRAKRAVNRCRYPSFMVEFMLIDRFICGLNNTEMATIQLSNTWTLQQIAAHFVEQTVNVAANAAVQYDEVSVGYFHCVSSKAKQRVIYFV